ncbi:hypothetical protein [Streptomyces sp. NPDC002537]
MSQGQSPPTGSAADTRIAEVMSEIEALRCALRATGDGPRRTRLLIEIALAGQRLADLALVLSGSGEPPPRSRWGRRRVLAARGAAWILSWTSRDSHRDSRRDSRHDGHDLREK